MNDEMDFTLDAPFWVDDWHIDPATGRIQRQDTVVKLEPKVMTVLICLARQAGAVISREQLESTAWSGMVVGYDSLASTIIKLRRAFGDDSKNPRIIETVPKKGYRLIARVKPAQAADKNKVSPAEPDTPKSLLSPIKRVLIGLITGAVLIPIVAWLFTGPLPLDSSPAIREVNGKPAIAVLPFKNISNDPEQDYFSDGMTADLITDLSKISGLSVIARNSVFAYKNSDVDVRDIGAELGVNYVIEGSVRKAGDIVRISARLIDSDKGYNLWADRFDGTLRNVFALQDEVTAKIVASLEVKLTETERVQLAHKYTHSIEAYDYFLHGWQHLWEFSKDGNINARDYYLKAVELDENFARAYANLAITYVYDFMYGWSDTSEQSLEQANLNAHKAIELDASLPQVHWAMGLTELYSKKYQKALYAAEKAIVLEPNFADGYGLLAAILNFAGNPQQALIEMQKAMRLNPRHPFIYKVICGEIYFNLHDYNHAIDYFTQALARNPQAQEPRLWLAAAYAHVGRIDDANWELEEIHIADENLSIERIEQVIPFRDPRQRKHLIDGLYKAGLAL